MTDAYTTFYERLEAAAGTPMRRIGALLGQTTRDERGIEGRIVALDGRTALVHEQNSNTLVKKILLTQQSENPKRVRESE